MPSAPIIYELVICADNLGSLRALEALARHEPAVRLTQTFVASNPVAPGMLLPVDEWERPPVIHFIGFRGEEYWSAVKIWGLPDVYHRLWDERAAGEIADGDLCVFAKGGPDWRPSPYNYDDSNQPDDPAARERLNS